MKLRVTSPYSGELVREYDYHGSDEIRAKLVSAQGTQRLWSALPIAERAQRLTAGLAYFEDNAQEIARDVSLQMGKPLAQSRGELAAMLDRARYMIEVAQEVLAPDCLPRENGLLRRIDHVPHGIVLDLAAWNYPLLIPVNVVVPALLAGNAVLLKHSARTPLCATHFARAFEALAREVPGGAQGLVSELILDHAAVGDLIADSRIDHVAFTGSVMGGRAIQRAAVDRFIDVGLELGGKDAAYVARDADLEQAIAGIVDGSCYNAGQSCCAVERVYVHEDLYGDFLEGAQEALGAYVMGDPLDEATTLGPMAQGTHALEALSAQVEEAVEAGARLLCGGKAQDERFFQPTLLADCPQSVAVMREESFGPLLPVQSVGGDEQALELMNDSDLGLTASVWTQDVERAEKFARWLDVGTVFMNRCDYLDPALAWAGRKDSGRGVTLSRYGLLGMTRPKSIHFRVE